MASVPRDHAQIVALLVWQRCRRQGKAEGRGKQKAESSANFLLAAGSLHTVRIAPIAATLVAPAVVAAALVIATEAEAAGVELTARHTTEPCVREDFVSVW